MLKLYRGDTGTLLVDKHHWYFAWHVSGPPSKPVGRWWPQHRERVLGLIDEVGALRGQHAVQVLPHAFNFLVMLAASVLPLTAPRCRKHLVSNALHFLQKVWEAAGLHRVPGEINLRGHGRVRLAASGTLDLHSLPPGAAGQWTSLGPGWCTSRAEAVTVPELVVFLARALGLDADVFPADPLVHPFPSACLGRCSSLTWFLQNKALCLVMRESWSVGVH